MFAPMRNQSRWLRLLSGALLAGALDAPASAAGDGGAAIVTGIGVIGLLLLALYFLPSLIAFTRGHEYAWVIFAINLAAGWTLIGWAVAIIWAVWPRNKSMIDPFLGNPTGLTGRNAGDSWGGYEYGKQRGFEQERSLHPSSNRTLSRSEITQLERLSAMRDSGALTEAEFAHHKTRIIGRLLG